MTRVYSQQHLGLIAYPLGGVGAGCLCLQGTGSVGNLSLNHRPDYRNDPMIFSALTLLGTRKASRILEAPTPSVKVFAYHADSGLGLTGKSYGLPRFGGGSFCARFPFARIDLKDDDFPVRVSITGWSPFVPGDEDASSLPFAALEYDFTNLSDAAIDAVFYFCAENFMQADDSARVERTPGGFVLVQPKTESALPAAFCVEVDDKAFIDAAWLRRGDGWTFDVLTTLWKGIAAGDMHDRVHAAGEGAPSPGATLALPISLEAGENRRICLRMSWFVPESSLRAGIPKEELEQHVGCHSPWYAGQYQDILAVARDWGRCYEDLRARTLCFTDCFYDSSLPEEIMDAVASNLCILKSPTVLRQPDGALWGWEGCCDNRGSCHGSCSHVWNYAQAFSHLFPRLERSLRETEFWMTQADSGHQTFRARLPIAQEAAPRFHAASDGQLGGIIKLYREWRISGDTAWLRGMWPRAKKSLEYCIETWDPDHQGVPIEPHHNTYDIEFWGAEPMAAGFYLGALRAAEQMAEALGEERELYRQLYERGRAFMETQLFNGEYFYQRTQWEGLRARMSFDGVYPEVRQIMEEEGPRYQYGGGCLSDQLLGVWLAELCGLEGIVDDEKQRSGLRSIYHYNHRSSLARHANTQRPGYALNDESGLLLCSWPRGGEPSLPFIYCNEVWTGIEYQVASHLLMKGMKEEATHIVRACRARYDGAVRNPFNEYECGHWYARAMASYSLLQAYTGLFYDRVTKTLYVSKRNGDSFRCFICTADGFGTVEMKEGKIEYHNVSGNLKIDRILLDE